MSHIKQQATRDAVGSPPVCPDNDLNPTRTNALTIARMSARILQARIRRGIHAQNGSRKRSKSKDVVAAPLTLSRDEHLAYVMISHDIAAISWLADKIAVLRDGRIVELASTSRLIAAPHDPYSAALIATAPRLRHDA